MRQHLKTVEIGTNGPGLHDVTRDVRRVVDASQIRRGLVTCFLRHTSASLLIQENADRNVLSDLETFMRRLVPRDLSLYRHTTEGPDDMPAHIRTALTAISLSIPVDEGAMLLGTWQAIYLFEHRDRPHRRELIIHLIGES